MSRCERGGVNERLICKRVVRTCERSAVNDMLIRKRVVCVWRCERWAVNDMIDLSPYGSVTEPTHQFRENGFVGAQRQSFEELKVTRRVHVKQHAPRAWVSTEDDHAA